MASETPEGHFEHPDASDQLWLENGYTSPDGDEQTHDGIVDWLEQLEIRVQRRVDTPADLPAPDPDRVETRTGDERLALVRDDPNTNHDAPTLVRDTGTEWAPVGGVGSNEHPLPPIETGGASFRGWRVVDVTARGADPEGFSDSGPAINDALADNTLVVFPTGQYLIETGISIDDFQDVGLWAPGDAVLQAGPNLGAEKIMACGNGTPGEGFYLSGVDFDISQNDIKTPLLLEVTDRLRIEDVTCTGTYGESSGGGTMITVGIHTVDGTGWLRNVRLPDGGIWPSTGARQDGATGIIVKDTNVGTIVYEDCYVEGFPDNGLRHTTGGRAVIRGGYFKNNNFSNVRVLNGRHYVEGCKIVVDNPNSSFPDVRPMYLNGEPLVVNDIDIEYLSDAITNVEDVVTVGGQTPSATLEDIRIHMDHSAYGIRVRGTAGGVPARTVTLRGVRVTGAADDTKVQHVIRSNRTTEGTVVVEEPYIDQQGTGRVGVTDVDRLVGGDITTDAHGTLPPTNGVVAHPDQISSVSRNAITTTLGDDVAIWASSANVTDVNAGTRTRWNGIIGGGPIGGYDIGSLTGATAGDVAMADGTTATNADTLWVLKSTGDWQRVDGGATITPA